MFSIDKKWFQFLGFSCILFIILVGVSSLRTSFQKERIQEKANAKIVRDISNQYKIAETVKSLKGTKWTLFSSDDSLAYDIRSGLVNYKEFEDDLNRERALQAEHGDPIQFKGFLEFYDDDRFQFRTDIFRKKTGDFEKSVISDFSYIEEQTFPGMLRFEGKNDESGGWIKVISPHFIVSRIKYGDIIFVREGYDNLCVEKKDILNKKLIKYYELEAYHQYKKSGKIVQRVAEVERAKIDANGENSNPYDEEDYYYDYNNFLVGPRYFVRSDGYLDGIPGLTSYAGYVDDERSNENFKVFKELLEKDISNFSDSDLKEGSQGDSDSIMQNIGIQEMVCCSLEDFGISGNFLLMRKRENGPSAGTGDDSQCVSALDSSSPYAKRFFIVYPHGLAIECQVFHDIEGVKHIMASEIYVLVD